METNLVNWAILGAVVLSGTGMWPVNRWAMHRGARPEMIGIMISIVCMLIGASLAIFRGESLFVPKAMILGAASGVAYALGFVLIIFYCLKIGPSGPTVTMNNLGLLWPVVISMLWFSPQRSSHLTLLLGLATTILALVIMMWNSPKKSVSTPMTARWARWAFLGWIFSGISLASQFLASQYFPQTSSAWLVSCYGVSGLILLCICLKRGFGFPRSEEIVAGVTTGILTSVCISVTIWLLTRMAAAIVFPVSVAAPIVLMLLIGRVLYKEHLTPAGWAASSLGVIGLALLGLS